MSLGSLLLLIGLILSIVSIVLYMFVPHVFSQTAMYSVSGTGGALLLVGWLLSRMK
jgi:competence protein ComGC